MSDNKKEQAGKGLGKNASEVIMGLVNLNHGMATNLVGVCIIILTFFLGLTFQSGYLNNILFQVVIAIIVVDFASFGLSGLYYSLYESSFISNDERKNIAILKKADNALTLGLILIWQDPALITLALGIYWVALLGFALSFTVLGIAFYEIRQHKVHFIVANVYMHYLQNPESYKDSN
jgi:hypothetical protein